jgi:hypothetical protein
MRSVARPTRCHIYTAAEIAFDSEVGHTPIRFKPCQPGGRLAKHRGTNPGTGQSVSYVTPTRSKAQQYYYRVSRSP